MPAPKRSSVTSPIQEFLYIPSDATCESINALVADINVWMAMFAAGSPSRSLPFAQLPTANVIEGVAIFVTDGRKIGEETLTGTGVWAYWSTGRWLRESTDSPVSAASGGMMSITTEAAANILTEAGGTITTGG